MKRLAAILLSACFLAACDPANSPALRQDADQIEAADDAQVAAIAAEDIDGVVAPYAPDAILRIPGAPQVEGVDAMRSHYEGLFNDPNGALSIARENTIVASAGDYGVTEGTFSVTYTNGATNLPETQTGNYLMVWRRQDDGSWKIIRDVVTPGATTIEAPAEDATPAAP